MAKQPKPESPKADDAEFQRVVGNLLKSPPKPHDKPEPGRRRGKPIAS